MEIQTQKQSLNQKKHNNSLLEKKSIPLKFSDNQIRNLLQRDVLEFVLIKASPESKVFSAPSIYNRIVCTANTELILSNKIFKYEKILNFRSQNWYSNRRLVLAWDFVSYSWKTLSLSDYSLINIIQIVKKEDTINFIESYKQLMALKLNDIRIRFS